MSVNDDDHTTPEKSSGPQIPRFVDGVGVGVVLGRGVGDAVAVGFGVAVGVGAGSGVAVGAGFPDVVG